jgi:hypothetical protein
MLDGKIGTENITHFCRDDQEILKQYDEQPADDQLDKKFRLWTDISGTKKIEAKLIGIQDGKAKFQLKNGQTGTMNIKSFSETDQKLIRQFQEQKSTT